MKFTKETISFIQDIYNTQDFIPLHVPTFSGNEKKYLLETNNNNSGTIITEKHIQLFIDELINKYIII